MISVVHITEAFCGGVATYLRTILPMLVSPDCRVSLICSLERAEPDAGATIDRLEMAGLSVSVVPMQREVAPRSDATSFRQLASLLSQGRFDVVHTHSTKAGALGRLAARLVGVPLIVHTPHCFAFLRSNRALPRAAALLAEMALARATDVLVGVSTSETGVARRYHLSKADRYYVLSNPLHDCPISDGQEGTTGSDLRLSLGLPSEHRLVLMAARLVPYKGIDRFVEACRLSRCPNVSFAIAGDGPLRTDTSSLLRRLDLEGRLHVLGHVTDMQSLYRAADVVVSCSDMEGEPYAILEAMRTGRAIVATAVPGNSHLLQHGTTALLTTTEPPKIAAAIDRLLGDEGLRVKLGRAARYAFVARPGPEAQANRLMEIYTHHLRRKATPMTERTMAALSALKERP